jgi:hypothetical protein
MYSAMTTLILLHVFAMIAMQGNWNNVLEVKQPPTIEKPEEQQHFAMLQAAYSAFETKLKAAPQQQ